MTMALRCFRSLHRPLPQGFSPPKALITTYIRDVLRTKSLTPSNPLLEHLQKPPSASSSFEALPKWSAVRPHHLQEAAKSVQQDLVVVRDKLTKEQPVSLADWKERSDLQANLWFVTQSSALLLSMDEKAFSQSTSGLVNDSLLTEDMEALIPALENLIANSDHNDKEDLVGLLKECKRKLDSSQHLSPEERVRLSEWNEALEQVAASLQAASPDKGKSAHILADMYTYLGLRGEQAKLHGHKTAGQWIVSSLNREFRSDEIKIMHETVGDRVRPLLPQESEKAANDALHELLERADSRPAMDKHAQDARDMLRLEKHVTLDGVVNFVTLLTRDWLGLCIVPDTSKTAWDASVRTFHVYDELADDAYIGSVWLDPFDRPGKMARSVTIPLQMQTATKPSLLAVSLEIKPPVWDDDPTPMTWDNVTTLLHEFGHVYQCLLTKSPTVTTFDTLVAGPNLEASEFLPKLMEHWLTEDSTIYALMEASANVMPFEDDQLDAARRVRAREKAQQLAQLCFFGELERQLFDNDDPDFLRQTSMLDLQSTLAQHYVPHDMPHRQDLTPLLDIFQDHSSNREMAFHRYLLGEVTGALVFDVLQKEWRNPDARLKLQSSFRRFLASPRASLKEFLAEWGVEMDQAVSTDSLLKRYRM